MHTQNIMKFHPQVSNLLELGPAQRSTPYLFVRVCICCVVLWVEAGVCTEYPQVRGRVVRIFLGHDANLGLSGDVRNAGRCAG